MSSLDFNFEAIVKNAKDIVIVTKADSIDSPGPEIVYVNNAFTRLTGYTSEEVIGNSPRILQPKDYQDAEVKAKIRSALQQQIPVNAVIKNVSKSGREYWLDMNIFPLRGENGEVTHFAAIERDITAQKAAEQQLELLAKTDPLTNLLNRRAFNERLATEHSRYLRTGSTYSLLMLDVDFFKSINDTQGHAAGDKALKIIADTCLSILRVHDAASRLGGDEFCIILPSSNLDSADLVANKIRKSVVKASMAQMARKISISIGIAEVEEGDSAYEEVLKRADKSLYDIKHARQQTVEFSELSN